MGISRILHCQLQTLTRLAGTIVAMDWASREPNTKFSQVTATEIADAAFPQAKSSLHTRAFAGILRHKTLWDVWPYWSVERAWRFLRTGAFYSIEPLRRKIRELQGNMTLQKLAWSGPEYMRMACTSVDGNWEPIVIRSYSSSTSASPQRASLKPQSVSDQSRLFDM